MELRKEIHNAIDLLPESILQAFYLIANEHINQSVGKKPVRPPFKFGSLKGKIQISDDFDEEMDEYGRFASESDFGKPVKEAWE